MAKIFISYAREDAAVAHQLNKDLQRAGVETWIDSENILVGQGWKREIQAAIKQSDFFLAVMSKKSIGKQGYVQREVRQALETLDEMPPGRIFVIPVRLDDCEPGHTRLRELNYVDLFRSYSKGLHDILYVLRNSPTAASEAGGPLGSSRTASSGKEVLLHAVVSELAPLEREKFLRRLNNISRESAMDRRMIENMYLEHHLERYDWVKLISNIVDADAGVGVSRDVIREFCRERIFAGPSIEIDLHHTYWSYRSLESFAMLMVKQGYHSSIDGAFAFIEGILGMEVAEVSNFCGELPLGSHVMWSFSDFEDDLPSVSAKGSHFWNLEARGPLLLFKYRLGEDERARVPTFCDFYASSIWGADFSLSLPGEDRSWDLSLGFGARPRPQVVHQVIHIRNLITPVQVLPLSRSPPL